MKVTDIVPQKNNNHRVSVFVDNEYAFSLDETDAILLKVKIGTELSNKDIERLTMEGNFTKARDYAFSILSHKMLTEKMLCDKLLEKGYDKAVVFEVSRELISLGYLNDEAYANLFLEHSKEKLWGKKKIRYEMEKKGLSNETIAVSLEDFQEDVMQEAVARTILKKYGKKDLSDYKVRASITRHFAMRGFDFSFIDKCIRLSIEEAENE